MATTVEIPGVGSVDFPDSMSPDEIQHAIQTKISPPMSSQPTGPATGSEIRAEPSWIERSLKSVLPEILPTAGLMGGGVLGGVAGLAGGPLAALTAPGGAVVGAGLGYAAGQQGNRAMSALMNVLGLGGSPGPSAAETAATIGKDVVRGGAMEATGQSLGAMAGKVADILRSAGVPLFGSGAPADLAVQAAAQRQGIELPASAATGSRTLASLEAVPGRYPIGAQQAQQFYDRTALSAQRAAERLAQSSGSADVETLGPAIQQSLDEAQAAARAKIDPMFAAVRSTAESAGSSVPLTRTAEVAQQIADVEGRMGALGRRNVERVAESLGETSAPTAYRPPGFEQYPPSVQQAVIDQYGLAEPAAVAPRDVLELQSRLNALTRSAPNDVSRRALVQLRDAVGQDLADWSAASGSNVDPLRQQAAAAYKEQIVPYFTEKAPLRAKLMDRTPDQAATSLLSMRDPALVRDAMTFLSPEVQDRVRAATLDDLVQRSMDPATNRFSTVRFMTQKARVPDEIWSKLLTEDQAGAMNDLGEAFQRINTYARGAANPSGTGQAILASHQTQAIGAVLLSTLMGWQHPAAAAGEVALLTSPGWAGKMLYSPTVQGLLSRQPQAPMGMDALTRLLGIGAVQGEQAATGAR